MNVTEVDDVELSFLPNHPHTKEGAEVIRCMFLFISSEVIAYFHNTNFKINTNFVLLFKPLKDAYYL